LGVGHLIVEYLCGQINNHEQSHIFSPDFNVIGGRFCFRSVCHVQSEFGIEYGGGGVVRSLNKHGDSNADDSALHYSFPHVPKKNQEHI
jgi:hypothetical protein